MNADRMLRNMMQSMGMGMPFDPFGDLGQQQGMSQGNVGMNPMMSMLPQAFMSPMSMQMSMPMPMMMNPFQNMQSAMSAANNGQGGFSYCSSSVTSYTTDEHGRPQVYQQSSEVNQGPSGLKETKSSIRDSRTGHQELAIGHHLHDKAHIEKRSKNVYTGEEEQAEDFINLEENEAETFEQNWQRQARSANITHNQIAYDPYGRPIAQNNNRLAITSSADQTRHNHLTSVPTTSYSDKSAMKSKKKKKKSKDEMYS